VKAVRFKKIDAFATEKSSGNPAGAVYLGPGDNLSHMEMQRIAAELKGFVSEVGYAREIDENTYELKYFSSEKEVEFCGHATIAIMYDLVKGDPRLLARETVEVVTNKGTLVVENHIASEDAVFITAPDPLCSSLTDVGEAAIFEALGIDRGTLRGGLSLVNAGLETLIVPMDSLESVLSTHPSMDGLKAFCQGNAIDIVLIFSDEATDEANRCRTRVFAPVYGYLEDPATGSGNAALGYYLLNSGAWDGNPISLEQNGDALMPNRVRLRARTDGTGKTRVLFGGKAVVRIAGEYILC
jgi:PhzF family phenazine biosynthesis protein